MRILTEDMIQQYKNYLIDEEKALATVEKYIHDVFSFKLWVDCTEVTKSVVIEYKQYLTERYAPTSVNSILSSLNSFFIYNGWYDCRTKTVKIQRRIFASTDKELSKSEYERLLDVAKEKKNNRLYYLIQTICSTGIRISELKHITVEAVMCGKASINSKGKIRIIFLPGKLCKILKRYIKINKIKSGSIFVTKSGKPLDRSNIWSDLKKLCISAGVEKRKVFPHNFRHLFAKTYYTIQKDIVRLADILGHSSVNTTRIYTMESGDIHRKHLQELGLLRL